MPQKPDAHMKRWWITGVGATWLILAAFGPAAQGWTEPSVKDYAGVWVMKLGKKNFFVLKLRVADSRLTGTVSHPKHFQTGDGFSFSHVDKSFATAEITRSSVEQGRLQLVVQSPADKNDRDEYEMELTAPGKATFKAVGFPFDPWTVMRVDDDKAAKEVATDWDESQSYSMDEGSNISNPEMEKIFAADQKARQSAGAMTTKDWEAIEPEEQQRREATRQLLAAGRLHTGKDFAEAAFIFQHGGSPEDYLLAHTLAVIAVAKGDSGSTWIAAATLDRYLQSVGKPQIYGTQFKSREQSGGAATQEPYNRDLVSDALRREMGVPTLATQQQQLKQYATPPTKPQ